ncbi:MAG TPA: winged helix-turn-helix transcriptional regulator [Thermoplasmata archaeon]|nr:winged helix-turn-helix transcriptional regulator [Thermoplasmata archaeon]
MGAPSRAPLRERIVDEVARHPGSSAREIQRRLGVAWGETAYHLDRLARDGTVRRERGGWRDYYFTRDLTWADRRIFQALRSPAERRLVLTVLEFPGETFTPIVSRTGLARSTASFHLGHLVALGVLHPPGSGGAEGYEVLEPDRIRRLLTTYSASFADGLVDRFVAAFGGLLREGTT